MLSVPTALLLHTTPTGRHYDWLVGTPEHGRAPAARLWTARVDHPSGAWRELETLGLTVIAPHRRSYLDYQGPIGGGRGHVRRVDRGEVVIHQWRAEKMLWDVRLQHFQGQVRADMISGETWRAKIIGRG